MANLPFRKQLTGHFILVFSNGESVTIDTTHPKWIEIVQSLLFKDFTTARELADETDQAFIEDLLDDEDETDPDTEAEFEKYLDNQTLNRNTNNQRVYLFEQEDGLFVELEPTTDDIDNTSSGFAGLPADDTAIIPRSVALEIARGIDEPNIECYHNGKLHMTFNNIHDAAEYAFVTPSMIRRVLKGNRKTTAGYVWKYEKQKSSALPPSSIAHQENGTVYGGKSHNKKS